MMNWRGYIQLATPPGGNIEVDPIWPQVLLIWNFLSSPKNSPGSASRYSYFFIIRTLCYVRIYVAIGRVDFPPEPDSQLIFTPNISIACVNITVIDDDEVEDIEVFLVSLTTNSTDVTLQPNTTRVIIVDNDGPGVLTSQWLKHSLSFFCS